MYRSVLKIIGVLLFTPLVLLWQLLNQFLLSPWGLIVPMTLLLTLVVLQQIQKTPPQLTQFYVKQFDTCDESELPRLLEALLQLGDAGVSSLVKGLASRREPVFAACLNVLRHEFDRWQESPQREHYFRLFSEALFQTCDQFSPAAQAEAVQFVDIMMQIRSEATPPESTADRQQMIVHCEQIYSQLESIRRRRLEPQHKDFTPPNDTVASLNRRAKQPVLLAANGQPFVPTSAWQENAAETLLVDVGSYNPYAAARADRLYAYQQSQQLRPWVESPTMASFSPPPSMTAEVETRIAQNFSANDSEQAPAINISEEYRTQKLSESGGTFNSDNFLLPELRNIPLDRVPNLPTTQLMQLLHHGEQAYVESARRTLISREGFQEAHLKLAWRLYHPIPAVRQEIVTMLPHTSNIQPSVWLSVLLNDPSSDVRYRTASFLATTSDPALRRLLIDRGKRDSDARIVDVANRLDESQSNVRH